MPFPQHVSVVAEYFVHSGTLLDSQAHLNQDTIWSDDTSSVHLSGPSTIYVPTFGFNQKDFSVAVWVLPNTSNTSPIFIYSNWDRDWEFLLVARKKKVGSEFEVVAALKESDGEQTVNVKGGCLKYREWCFVVLSWADKEKSLSLYVDNLCVGRSNKMRLLGKEGKWENKRMRLERGGTFGWNVRGVMIGDGAVRGFVDLAMLGCDLPEEFEVMEELFVGRGEDINFLGESQWVEGVGVEMNGVGGAQVPAFGFVNERAFSVGVCVSVERGGGEHLNVFSDWKEEKSFRLGLKRDKGQNGYAVLGSVCVDNGSEEKEGEIVTVRGGVVEEGEWTAVSMSWECGKGLSIYVNGERVGYMENIDADMVRETGHSMFDVGIDGDAGGPFKGGLNRLSIVKGSVALF